MRDHFRVYLFHIGLLLLAACGDSNHQVSWEEFRAQVYQEPSTGLFIVNGDELIENEQGLREVFTRMVIDEARAKQGLAGLGMRTQQLTVNRVAGRDDVWSPLSASNLTYCVSSSSFGANYTTVVDAMNSAASAWSATGACINFVHAATLDSGCSNTSASTFNVRLVSGQPYYARSFFPSSSRDAREILIDGSAFGSLSSLTLAGVLRHELGHALGLRHEHTRPEAGTCYEDSNWRAVTDYDPYSVMHYPWCNGRNKGDLNITELDRAGINILYENPQLNIVGDYDICTGSSATYSILPSSAIRTWSMSPIVGVTMTESGGLATVSNISATDQTVTLNANIASCGRMNPLSISIDLGVISNGKIAIQLGRGDDPNNIECSTIYTAQVKDREPHGRILGYNWSFPSDEWSIVGPKNMSHANFAARSGEPVGYLEVKLRNKCGWNTGQGIFMTQTDKCSY